MASTWRSSARSPCRATAPAASPPTSCSSPASRPRSRCARSRTGRPAPICSPRRSTATTPSGARSPSGGRGSPARATRGAGARWSIARRSSSSCSRSSRPARSSAATTSLPEEIGGVRNWDYRYVWVRDAAFTLYGFLRLGYTEEAARFMEWLSARVSEEDGPTGPLQLMYGIDGRHELPEVALTHLDGYRGSRPVRVGNGATTQLQLDIYGELIDSVYLFDKYGSPISYDFWRELRRMAYWICQNWEQEDESIWEVRGGKQQFVYSKLQCWVALDRTLRLSSKRSLPLDRQRVACARDDIYEAIMARGWDAQRRTFVQAFGGAALDASNLLMPLMRFISPTDPRILGTLDRTLEELASDTLVHRYELGKGAGDGLTGKEGTFSICTFWLVEALARAGRLDDARFIFEKMLTYANHLGLYSEQIGPSGELLGNFPQAFTHLGLVSAAFYLDRALGQGG
nr:glycoside hydrolase family 15 protein [Sorangium aterium]